MAFSRGAIFGQQVGAGLSSGLNAALQQKVKMKQIEDMAKRFNIDPKALAAASFGLPAMKGSSFEERLMQSILGQQYPELANNPQVDPYGYLNKPATQPMPQPVGDMPGTVVSNTGAAPLIKKYDNEFPEIPDNSTKTPQSTTQNEGSVVKIPVIEKKTGAIGYIPENEFNPDLYQKY